MADIIPAGYAECSVPFFHSALPRPAVVTWGVNLIGNVDPFSDQAEAIFQAFYDNYDQNIDSQVVMGPSTMRVATATGEILTVEDPSSRAGTAVRESQPASVALLVHKRTDRGGRRGRGRFYLPWALGEASVSDTGRVDAPTLAIFDGIHAAFLLALVSPGVSSPMVLLHSQGQTAPGDPDEVVTMVSDPIIGTQRRRLGR